MMTKTDTLTSALLMLVGGGLVVAGAALAQDPQDLPPEAAEFYQAVNDAAGPLSVDVEQVDFAVDSFFDVFVETVLREGLPAGVEDPVLGTALTTEEVTEIIQRQGPELREQLGVVQIPGPVEVDLTPGAAVRKWGRAGRWSRGPHRFNLHTWAQVNQWIRASMSSTQIAWNVFKPGVYSTDCMYLNVHSNGKMALSLENYGPLLGPDGSQQIPTAYAMSDYVQTAPEEVFQGMTMAGATPVVDWVPDGAQGSADVGPHKLVKVWNSIRVAGNVQPGLYSTPAGPSAVITVTGIN